MTWLVLEGVNVSEIMARPPVIADLAEWASARRSDGDLVGGVTAFFGISLQSFEVLVNRAMGRNDDDPDLRRVVLRMYVDWLGEGAVGDALKGDPSPC
jgi:hypothetical protein